MKILVIIPCYNEEKNILNVVNNLKKYNYDYVVINDGSTDNSKKVLKENNLNFIDLPFNVGIGGAVQTGYKYARNNDYDIAIQFDGDGQHDAGYIEKIIKPIIENKADMVIGSRFVGEDSKFKSTIMRRLGIKILSFLLNVITGKRIYDMTSGFRAINRKIIELFAEKYEQEYPEPTTNLEVAQRKYIISEVGVKMHERKYGKSSITFFKSAYYMFNVILIFFIKATGVRK